MKGVCLSREEGAIKDSVIKLNYLFTISKSMILKTLFSLSKEKGGVRRINQTLKRAHHLIIFGTNFL